MRTRPALASLLVTVALTGCAAGTSVTDTAAPAPATSPSPVAGAPSLSAAASPAPTAAPTPAGPTVAVSYTGGTVTGTDGREEVAVGEDVVLRLTSDVDEEVHVHGYDIEKVLPAGVPVDVPVQATIPGVFEVELHDSGKVLFQLRVS